MKLILVLMVGLILFGSWFPFSFHVPIGFPDPDMFLAHWKTRSSRGDMLANVLLYAPFGFFWVRALGFRGRILPLVSAALVGLALSLTVEVVQIFIPGRTTSVIDLACNAAGAALGAFAALIAGSRRLFSLGASLAQPMPLFLAAAWLGYRLFPFVPTIDWQKFKDALKPLLLYPSIGGVELARDTISWLVFGRLLATLLPGRHTGATLALVGGAVLLAKIPIVHQALRLSELVGIGIAALAWTAFGNRLVRWPALLAALMAAIVVANALLPFALRSHAASFHWLPFYGFLGGSTEINILSFLQKFFTYGALLWLLVQARMRLVPAALGLAALLFALELAQIMLVRRTAEITDAVLVLLIALIMRLLDESKPAPKPRRARAAA